MTRRRMTQIFPWLLPLRRWQRRFCFYAKMGWDGIPYATCRERQELPYPLFETSCPMYNRETGFDMVYQENKVFNLKLAAATLDHLLIRPGETFSFWRLVRYADRDTPYRDGLAEVDGKLCRRTVRDTDSKFVRVRIAENFTVFLPDDPRILPLHIRNAQGKRLP